MATSILPHERNNHGHNLARIKWENAVRKELENYFTVKFPMGDSRQETIITPVIIESNSSGVIIEAASCLPKRLR
jgi:hypothetical protein